MNSDLAVTYTVGEFLMIAAMTGRGLQWLGDIALVGPVESLRFILARAQHDGLTVDDKYLLTG